MRVLLAGASGLVGFATLRLLHERGHQVRTLSRDAGRAEKLRPFAHEVRLADATRPGALAGLCDGVDAVISALGAPVSPGAPERKGFSSVDEVANLALIEEARRAGVSRFVYVSVYTLPGYAGTAYIQAHARVEQALAASGLSRCVVRPTGVFGAFTEFLGIARRGLIPLFGDGSATTNPVHERDVAEAVVGALDPQGPSSIDIGGPQILTRRQIAALAFEAVGKRPRFLPIPLWLLRPGVALVGLFNPRAAEFLRFLLGAAAHPCVAPSLGKLPLGDYLAEQARALRLPGLALAALRTPPRKRLRAMRFAAVGALWLAACVPSRPHPSPQVETPQPEPPAPPGPAAAPAVVSSNTAAPAPSSTALPEPAATTAALPDRAIVLWSAPAQAASFGFTSDGASLLVREGASLRLVEAATGRVTVERREIAGLAGIDPGRARYIEAEAEQAVIREVASGKATVTLPIRGMLADSRGVSFSSDGSRLSWQGDGDSCAPQLWDVARAARIPFSTDFTTAAPVCDGTLTAGGRSVYFQARSSGAFQDIRARKAGPPRGLATISPRDTFLVTFPDRAWVVDETTPARLLAAEGGRTLYELDNDTHGASFSANERLLATLSPRGVEVRTTGASALLLRVPLDSPSAVAFAPRAGRVAALSGGRLVIFSLVKCQKDACAVSKAGDEDPAAASKT